MKNPSSLLTVLMACGALGLTACAASKEDSGDDNSGGTGTSSGDTGNETSGDGDVKYDVAGGDGGDGDGCGDGDGDGGDGCGTDDSGSAVPIDLTPYLEEIEARCAGVFTGHGEEHQEPGAIPCRYDGVGYTSDIQLDGEPHCTFEAEDADCGNATGGTIQLLGDLVAEGDTYVVTGLARVYAQDVDSVTLTCGYIVEDRNPAELPNLEESGGEIDRGVTYAQWRHEDYDQGDYLDWEYCNFVTEEHTPPG
jgi:hypothetical protein